jgi:BASS family bile acid:Na+ symporter
MRSANLKTLLVLLATLKQYVYILLHMPMMTRLFPLWALLFSFIAWLLPELFIDAKQAILPLLALIMFAMGLTLQAEDFRRVLLKPLVVLLGLGLQFGLMPLLAWLIAGFLQLEPMLAAGLILVGACSGGTASNVMTYLSGGDVALSITITACSTLLAVVMTPWLSWLYIDAAITVPTWLMFKSIVLLVIVPVTAGVTVNCLLRPYLQSVLHYCPLLAMAAIVMIIAIVVALNNERISQLSWLLLIAVMLHNLFGLILGYVAGKALGFSSVVCRTLAIEVGMQNSGLAVALALKFFTPLAALPGALFSIWHNLSGAVFASFWQSKQRNDSYKK